MSEETFFVRPKALLKRTSTKAFLNYFAKTFAKRKLRQKGFESFRTAAFLKEQLFWVSSGKKEIATKVEKKGT